MKKDPFSKKPHDIASLLHPITSSNSSGLKKARFKGVTNPRPNIHTSKVTAAPNPAERSDYIIICYTPEAKKNVSQ